MVDRISKEEGQRNIDIKTKTEDRQTLLAKWFALAQKQEFHFL